MQSSTTTDRTFNAHKGVSRAILSRLATAHHSQSTRVPLRGASGKVAMASSATGATTLDSISLTVYGDEGGRVYADLAGAGFSWSELAEAANQLATVPATGRIPQKHHARAIEALAFGTPKDTAHTSRASWRRGAAVRRMMGISQPRRVNN